MNAIKLIIPRIREPPEVNVYDIEGKPVSRITLPEVFSIPVRIDLIRRAHHSALSASIQQQGRDPLAGKRRVGESWGIGYSVARVPRLDNGRAVFAPMTRGGRRAHAPTIAKVVRERINHGERLYAVASAIAATSMKEYVLKRGHVFNNDLTLPVVVTEELENIESTRKAREFLRSIGVWSDVDRAQKKVRIRAGKGKMRGRRYAEPKSVLVVVSRSDSKAIAAFRNMPGVDVTYVGFLGIEHLAPGGVPGRLMIISEQAVKMLGERFRVIYV